MSLADLWHLLTKKQKVLSQPNSTKEELEEKKNLELQERRNQADLHRLQIDELKRLQTRKSFEDVKESIFDTDMEYEDEGEEEGAIAGMFGSILQNAMPKQNNNQFPSIITPQPTQPTQPTKSSVTDEDIRAFIAKSKRKHINMAKIMPKELVKRRAMTEANFTDDEAERAYVILMNEF
jgi:hypothetical protein